MKIEKLSKNIEIPQGVQIIYEKGDCTVKGEKGDIKKKLFFPGVDIKIENNDVEVFAKNATKREKKVISCFAAHIRNMIKGVTKGHIYELKICAGHFPMNVSVSNDTLIVKNYIGEKVPRVLKIKYGVKVTVNGEIIKVEHIDKEKASQVAAEIEILTRRKNFDRRVFQDGIYIINKDGKAII